MAITSQNTSIRNQYPLPHIFQIKKCIELMKNKKVIDIGCGKYTNHQLISSLYDADIIGYDPYVLSKEENHLALSKTYQVAVLSNVLNVIPEQGIRYGTLRLAASLAPIILISVYQGNKSGIGKQTKPNCWQQNRKKASYLPEIKQALYQYHVQSIQDAFICIKND